MTENGKKISQRLINDKKVLETAKNCKTLDEVVSVLNKNGYSCTKADFEDAATNQKVSLNELNKIAGGTTCVCVVGGGGGSTSDKHNCICVLYGSGGSGDNMCQCGIAGGGTLDQSK